MMTRTKWPTGRRVGLATGAFLWLMVASTGCEPVEEYDVSLDPAEPFDSTAEQQATAPLVPTPAQLAAVTGEVVVGRTGPGGDTFEVATHSPDQPGHERRIGQRTFEISLRGSPSTTEACGSCHRPGRPVIQAERIEDAHRYVLPKHPEESGTHCLTCHATDDVESLVLASGERVSLDHAYRLCAQCHYEQVDAWAAGTHGKRLDGWSGRRVVMGCADCHDPHAPAIEPRIPYPGPQLPTTGTDSP